MLDIAVILTTLVTVAASQAINYCGSKMCDYTNEHTFCQFAPVPGPECSGYMEAYLSSEEKARLLVRLNKRRHDVASGKLRAMPTAGNMLKLRWVEELAREAQLWADQCRPPQTPEEHDVCRNLYSITVGQCVASVVGEAPGLRVESMVDIWYMQSMHYKGNITLYEPPEPDKHLYGDFAQMMWSRAYMVGCGRSKFMVPVKGRLRSIDRLVCNFAPQGPIPYRSVWTPGVPATMCPPRSRPDKIFPSLCDYQYELDVFDDMDNSMSIEEHVLLNTVIEMARNKTQYYKSLDELYLTNLAIVTMQDSVETTPHLNSLQKRDLVEAINMNNRDNKQLNVNEFEKILTANTSITPYTNPTVSKRLAKKRMNLIGRPKTYNVEELSETVGDQLNENYEVSERVSKWKKYFYSDYNNLEILEDKETTKTAQNSSVKAVADTTTPEIARVRIENNTDATISSMSLYTESIITEQSMSDVLNTTTVLLVTTNALNETVSNTERSLEDYLSDPETVRQLQEALDRMEQSNSQANKIKAKLPKVAGKVRRDLSVHPTDEHSELLGDNTEQREAASNALHEYRPSEDEHNKTVGKGPLDMVLNYMPYLKQYNSDILGTTAASAAVRVYPSVVFMWILFV